MHWVKIFYKTIITLLIFTLVNINIVVNVAGRVFECVKPYYPPIYELGMNCE